MSAWIPKNARWYIADVVVEIRVQGDPKNVVHINTLLVRADSPRQAYDKALKLGRAQTYTYKNDHGKTVRRRFRGLADLNVIYDKLEHGAELVYTQKVGHTPRQLKTLLTPKRQLAV